MYTQLRSLSYLSFGTLKTMCLKSNHMHARTHTQDKCCDINDSLPTVFTHSDPIICIPCTAYNYFFILFSIVLIWINPKKKKIINHSDFMTNSYFVIYVCFWLFGGYISLRSYHNICIVSLSIEMIQLYFIRIFGYFRDNLLCYVRHLWCKHFRKLFIL